MSIKGKITARQPDSWLNHLPVGSIKYFPAYEILVTKKAFFVRYEMKTIDREDFKPSIFYIKVTRINEKLTPNSFEFDFTECTENGYIFLLEPSTDYDAFSQDSEYLMIPFTANQLEIVSESGESELEKLRREEAEANDREDYLELKKIREKIAALEKKEK